LPSNLPFIPRKDCFAGGARESSLEFIEGLARLARIRRPATQD
jgi:hypothetical protein